MISLAQVKELESRVGKVVDALKVQSAENASLRERISELETRLDELGSELSSQIADEKEIEAGLQGVFDILDRVDVSKASEEGETQSENDAKPGMDKTDSDAESPLEDSGNNHDAQTDADNSSPTPGESDAKPIPKDEIHHPDNSESESVGSDDVHAEDDRFQSEFDIF